jgi:phosphatidylglycerol:prolipoprotein diacylglycerol transferase
MTVVPVVCCPCKSVTDQNRLILHNSKKTQGLSFMPHDLGECAQRVADKWRLKPSRMLGLNIHRRNSTIIRCERFKVSCSVRVFMHPVLVTIGPIQIRFYGLMYVMAILVGYFFVKSEVKRKDMDLTPDDVMNFIFWVVLGGVIGARIYYVAFNWEYYWPDLREIVAIWHGGLAIHGGILGGLAAGFVYTGRKRIPFLRGADVVAPSLILGQAFGRLGNFMNGDAHGLPTKMPWGIVFPPGSIAGDQFPNIPLHPTMLYELAINLAIFVFLWTIRKRPAKDGFIISLYLILYSVGRFIVSFFRADSLMIGQIRAAHLISIVIIAIVIPLLIKGKLWRE